MNPDLMPSIFAYLDYRQFLRDYYEFMKKHTTFFSHRYFMNKAGIKSPNFLKNVMEGKKNLSKESTLKFAIALGLKGKEIDYFENCVFFEQCKTSDKKEFFLERMKRSCKEIVRTALLNNQSSYFSEWYHCVIRELIVLRNYQDDWNRLAKDIYPTITASQAKKSVELLLSLGLLIKNQDSSYSQKSQNITAGRYPYDVLTIRRFHKASLDNAKNAIDTLANTERTCSSLIISISEETYRTLEQEIADFRDRITSIANSAPQSDRVYQVAIQLFPVSNSDKKEKY